mmetsp:Transcript_1028/g.2998  ORF Transcript_1028/g.2998 Transcript_1028/m.2998 type:complete len:144 (+) Transcript_1028:430-861(+)
MDFFSLTGGVKAVKESVSAVESLVWDKNRAPPFGPGRPEEEAKCKQIRVFFRAVHRTQYEKVVMLLPPTTKLKDTRDVWAAEPGNKKLTQEHICDEFGYRIGHKDMDKELRYFSNGCNVNLDFTHSNLSLPSMDGKSDKLPSS